jgi:hypothetical protein
MVCQVHFPRHSLYTSVYFEYPHAQGIPRHGACFLVTLVAGPPADRRGGGFFANRCINF